jgi:hypothetical protein
MPRHDDKKQRSPFFARFLEGQQFPQVKSNVKAGKPPISLKYPSDDDTGNP